jgi:hypothetical protein
MKRNILFSILILFIVFFSMPFSVGAAVVTWNTEVYTAQTWAGVYGGPGMSDVATGPPLPISAYSEDYYFDGTDPNLATAYAEISDTTMYLSFDYLHDGLNLGNASFSGTYTAVDPYFIFSYDFSYVWGPPSSVYGHFLYIDIQDLTTSTTLHLSDNKAGSDVLYIPTPVGNEISVNFIFGPHYANRHSYSDTLTYSMSSAIVPEPVSSILFISGGTLLAGRRYIKRKKKA